MAVAKITSRGQVTIPKKIREHLGAITGKELVFEVTGQKEAVIKVQERPTAEYLAASLNPKNKQGTPAEWKKTIDKSKKEQWLHQLEEI